MQNGTRAFFSSIFFLVSFFLAVQAQADDVTKKLKKLVDSGQNLEAYQAASSHVNKYGGTPHFDFYMGLSAFGVEEYSQAAFAFERVLIAEPDHHEARLKYSETFIMLGNLDAARIEYNAVDASKLSDESKMVYAFVGEQLDSAESKLNSKYYLLVGFGVDDNINEATDNQVANFGAASIPLRGANKRITDTFFKTAFYGQWVQQLNEDLSWFAGAKLEHKENIDSKLYDKSNIGVSGGLVYNFKGHTFRIPFAVEQLYYDEEPFIYAASIGLDYFKYYSPEFQISYFVKLGTVHYHKRSLLDVDVFEFGAKWDYAPSFSKAKVTTKVFAGKADNQEGRGEQFDHNFIGFRSKVYWDTSHWTGPYLFFPYHSRPFMLVGYERRVYNETNPLFSRRQDDDYYYLSVGNEWMINSKTTATLQFTRQRNDSDATIYDFSQNIIEALFVYRF